MKTGKLSILALLLLGISSTPLSAFAGDNVIIIKGGSYKIDDRNQSIDYGNSFIPTTFENDTSIFAVEYDHVFSNGLSIGGGYQGFDIDYTSTSGSGDVTAAFFMFNGKLYFNENKFKPFIGFSAAFISADFNGGISGGSIGLGIAGMAGFRWQLGTVGLYAEYKNFFSAKTSDGDSDEVDLAGESITGGISLSF